MKRIVIAFLPIVILIGCASGGAGDHPGSTAIQSVGISGADGYARVWNSPAKLVRIDNGVPQHVEWTLENGTTVQVPVDNAKMVGVDKMFLSYTYEEQSHSQAAEVATGNLVDIPRPDNWGEIKRKQTAAYYVSNGKVLEVDPDTGSSTVLSGDATVPGNAFLSVNESKVPFAFAGSYKRSFPGGVARDLSSDPEAIEYYEGRSSETSSGASRLSVVYDPATDTHYRIDWLLGEIRTFAMNDDGSVTQGASTSFTSPIDEARRIGYGQATPDNSVWTSGYDNVYRITSFSPLTLESVALDRQPATWLDEAVMVDGKFYYKENTGSDVTVREVDLSAGAERVLISSTVDGLVTWEVVSGAVIWIDNAGSWKTDLATLATEPYSASDVEAVTE